jgi:hypothetical protein
LIFHNGERKGEGSDVDIFVGEVDSGVSLDVPEEVHWLIEVGNCVGLVSHEVVKAVRAVGIDEAVTNPFSGSNTVEYWHQYSSNLGLDLPLVNICDNLEGCFYSVIFNLSRLNCRNVVFSRESQDVEGILASN